MEILATWNPFQTEAAAWVDIGMYKSAVEQQDFRPFQISRLVGYEPNKVSINNKQLYYLIVLINICFCCYTMFSQYFQMTKSRYSGVILVCCARWHSCLTASDHYRYVSLVWPFICNSGHNCDFNPKRKGL